MFAAIRRESVLVRLALVAAQPSHTGLAVALSIEAIARRIEASNGIAFTALASISRFYVEIAALALVAVVPNDIRLAPTVAGQLFAN